MRRFPILLWVAALLCGAVIAGRPATGASAGKARRNKGSNMTNEGKQPLELHVEADKTYAAGFPVIVSLEIRNVSEGSMYPTFKRFGMFEVPPPATFVLR